MFALFVACAVFTGLAAQKQWSLAFISSDLMRFITVCSAMKQHHPIAWDIVGAMSVNTKMGNNCKRVSVGSYSLPVPVPRSRGCGQ